MYDDLSLFPRYNKIVGRIGVPWYNVPGNHELNFLSPDDRYSLETFKRFFGPTYYSFDYGRVHFVVIDDVDYLGSGSGDPESPHPRGRGRYEGRIGERQLSWLRNDLALVDPSRPVVVALHIPLRAALTDAPSVQVEDREALFDALSGRDVLVLAGHMHVLEHHYFDAEDGFQGPRPLHMQTLSTVSGSWWSGPFDERGIPVSEQRDGTPNGYHVMEVDGDDIRMRFKAAGHPDDFSAAHRVRRVVPPVQRQRDAGREPERVTQRAA